MLSCEEIHTLVTNEYRNSMEQMKEKKSTAQRKTPPHTAYDGQRI
jgi:hypothetical protein